MDASLVADARRSGANWAAEFLSGGGALDDPTDEAKAAADAYVRTVRQKRVWGWFALPNSARRDDLLHMRTQFLRAAYGALDRAKAATASASQLRRDPGEPDKASAAIRAAIEKSRRSKGRDDGRHSPPDEVEIRRGPDTHPSLRNKTQVPPPQEFGVSHEGAERLVAHWLRFLGVSDAEATRFAKDGGVDVESGDFVVQVKHQQGNVTSKDVQAIAGIAAASSRKALFFTSSSYTRDAATFADLANVGLFQFDAQRGTLTAVNDCAKRTFGISPGR